MNEGIIVVKQLPIIEEQLKTIKEEISKEVAAARALECTEETRGQVKKALAKLRRMFNELEEKRKEVRRMINAPYEQFENVYRANVTDVFNVAIADLQEEVNTVEDGLRDKKESEIREYFDELTIAKNVDFLRFEDAGVKVTLSASNTFLKRSAEAFVSRVADEVGMISRFDDAAEILVEYKQCLDAGRAIATVSERHKAIAAESSDPRVNLAERERESEEKIAQVIEKFGPPVVSEIPEESITYTVTFKVTTTDISKLKKLKNFMESEGITYEQH